MKPGPMHDLCVKYSAQYELPVDLLEAQVVQESSNQPDAFRFEHGYYRRYIADNAANVHTPKIYGPLAACSFGLLQIMLETAYEIGFTGRPEELFDANAGLNWGARRMAALWKAAGDNLSDYPKALAAYNGGPAMLHLPLASWPSGVIAYVASVYALSGRKL